MAANSTQLWPDLDSFDYFSPPIAGWGAPIFALVRQALDHGLSRPQPSPWSGKSGNLLWSTAMPAGEGVKRRKAEKSSSPEGEIEEGRKAVLPLVMGTCGRGSERERATAPCTTHAQDLSLQPPWVTRNRAHFWDPPGLWDPRVLAS